MAYQIIRFNKDGSFDSVMAGCGRNKGTWDTAHSRSAALRHAKNLRQEQPDYRFKVEQMFC